MRTLASVRRLELSKPHNPKLRHKCAASIGKDPVCHPCHSISPLQAPHRHHWSAKSPLLRRSQRRERVTGQSSGKKGRYFKTVSENDSSSVSSRHVTAHYFGRRGQKYTRKGWRQVARLFSNIKVFGLQSAVMSSHSLLAESLSYTSAIHVYIHHPC